MSETKRIGVEVDEGLWQDFREDVERRKGRISGVLASEVENALRQYIYAGDSRDQSEVLREIDERARRIEAAVGATGTDGGTDVRTAEPHTHAPEPTSAPESSPPETKPPANTATEKKVAWLAECVREEYGGDFREAPRSVFVETVKDEYGFRSDTAKRYVEELIDFFELKQHPEIDALLVTSDRYDEIVEQRREQLTDKAEEKL